MKTAILILAMILISNVATEIDENPTAESILSELVSVTVTRSKETTEEIRFWDIEFSKEEVESIRKYLVLAKPRSMNNPFTYSHRGSIRTQGEEWAITMGPIKCIGDPYRIAVSRSNPDSLAEFDIPSPHGIEFKRRFEKLCEHKMQRTPDRIEKKSRKKP